MPDYQLGALAPYNFVPLPQSVKKVGDGPGHESYHADSFSGYFDCSLTSLTPLYIRSTLNSAEYQAEERQGSKKKAEDDKPDFFSPGGELRLPGSSLRGMVRSLVEILSSSKPGGVGSGQMFFRALADAGGPKAKEAYLNRMTTPDQNGKPQNSSKTGYLFKEKNDYYILPAVEVGEAKRTKFRVDETVASRVPPKDSERSINWRRAPVWFEIPEGNKSRVEKLLVRNQPPANTKGWAVGWLITPGKAPTRGGNYQASQRDNPNWGKQKYWIIPGFEPDFDKKIPIPFEDVLAYRDAGGQTQLVSDFHFSVLPKKDWKAGEKLDDNAERLVPCFYTIWDDLDGQRHVSFGHTAYFRLPYKKRPGDHVPEQLKAAAGDGLDMVRSLFGTAGGQGGKAGRVYFEDGRLDPPQQANPLMETASPRILSSPKPTSYQLYLEQPDTAKAFMENTEGSSWQKYLQHWDSPESPNIRGHKLYWHRNPKDWNEAAVMRGSSQHTQIKAVRPGVSFRFRVRFDNLSREELGALAAALVLPAEMAHKLGMGKPLGLGSVRIDAKLYLIDRRARYSTGFTVSGTGWESGVGPPEDPEQFRQAFTKWLSQGEQSALANLWDDKRLSELKYMLTYEGRPAGLEERTRYMSIQPVNEFKNRAILLSPHEIWQGKADTHSLPPTPPASRDQTSYRPTGGGRNTNFRDRGYGADRGRYSPQSNRPSSGGPPSQAAGPSRSRLEIEIEGLTSVKIRKGDLGTFWGQSKKEPMEKQKILAALVLKKLKENNLEQETRFQKIKGEAEEILQQDKT